MSPMLPSAGPGVSALLPCDPGALLPTRLVGEASMPALGDLRSRLRLLGAGGDGGNALAVSAGEGMFGQA